MPCTRVRFPSPPPHVRWPLATFPFCVLSRGTTTPVPPAAGFAHDCRGFRSGNSASRTGPRGSKHYTRLPQKGPDHFAIREWLRSRTDQEKRPFHEKTVVACAKAARALATWMSKKKMDGDFTACDTAMLNSFFRDYNATYSRGGTNAKRGHPGDAAQGARPEEEGRVALVAPATAGLLPEGAAVATDTIATAQEQAESLATLVPRTCMPTAVRCLDGRPTTRPLSSAAKAASWRDAYRSASASLQPGKKGLCRVLQPGARGDLPMFLHDIASAAIAQGKHCLTGVPHDKLADSGRRGNMRPVREPSESVPASPTPPPARHWTPTPGRSLPFHARQAP
jgi:hypothetical protein